MTSPRALRVRNIARKFWVEVLSDDGTGAVTARSIGIVLAAYEVDRSRAVISTVMARMDELALSGDVVVVCNSGETFRDLQALSGISLIRGSNERGEFSAYREGIASFAMLPDVMLVLNDRALSYRKDNSALFIDRYLFNLLASRRTIVASVDYAPSYVCGTIVPHMRSNAMLMGRFAVPMFVGSVDDDLDRFLPDRYCSDVLSGTELHPRFRDFIYAWLTGAEDGRKSWYKAERLTARNFPAFRFKLESIVREAKLSADLLEQGVQLVDWRGALAVARFPTRLHSLLLREARQWAIEEKLSVRSRLTLVASSVSVILIRSRRVAGSVRDRLVRRPPRLVP